MSRGDVNGVFIDDTGSPGLATKSANLHPERKSWIAVLVPRAHLPDVMRQFPGALKELERLTGATEFHFSDLYQGRKQFAGVELEIRLRVIEFMAWVFETYKLPAIVQTLDPVTLAEWKSLPGMTLPDSYGPFDFSKPEDAALFFLLSRVRQHIEKNRGPFPGLSRLFVDEGYKKNGVGICAELDVWKPVFADCLINFAKSSVIHPLQLADFAAFVLNRHQLLLNKSKLSDLDKELLAITSGMVSNFVNIERRAMNTTGA